jgi:hypothetical protein
LSTPVQADDPATASLLIVNVSVTRPFCAGVNVTE